MKVKLCGITSVEDAKLAAECGAFALGLIFYPPSPRAVHPKTAAKIRASLPKNILTVGVFVNSSREEAEAIRQEVGFNYFQLSADETPDFCSALPAPFIKSFPLKSTNDLALIDSYAALPNFYAALIEPFVEKAYGGTGKTADWSLAQKAAVRYPVFLAGGLRADNVAEACSTVHPFALDLASGVEASPGKKDPEKTRRFFNLTGNLS